MRGKRTMQIPRGQYDRGEPEINLLLAVLAQAKSDASVMIPKIISNQYQRESKTFILSAKKMWCDFQKNSVLRQANYSTTRDCVVGL